MLDITLPIAGWLLTFLVHSTIWLGGAALFLRLQPRASAGLRDFLWRAALVASLVTPTAQLAAGAAWNWEPFGGAWSVAAQPAPAADLLLAPLPADVSAPASIPEASAPPLAFSSGPAAVAQPQTPAAPSSDLPWTALLLSLWAGGALLALSGLIRGTLRLRRTLRGRALLGESVARRALERLLRPLGGRAPRVRLTSSAALDVPIALGLARPEICVPDRALRELDAAQQSALVGHELCHVLRRDPLWLAAFDMARRIFFFQPLLILARRGAHDAAEELCDAWAARRTGNPVALAECLVEVARWLSPAHQHRAAACMARPDSPLRSRVARLLAADRCGDERLSRRLRTGIAGGMLGLALMLPGVSCQITSHAPWPDRALSDGPASAQAELDLIQEQMLWLEQELAATRTEWEFAAAQSPGFGSDRVGDRLLALQERLAALRPLAAELARNLPRTSHNQSSR
jgi:beta-lactamase regulating signal transducer with metallopeptidase domain